MQKPYILRIGPIFFGFAVANFLAAVTVKLTANQLVYAQSHADISRLTLNMIIIAAGQCSLIGGIVATYAERFSARKHSYPEKPILIGVIATMFHALFVTTVNVLIR